MNTQSHEQALAPGSNGAEPFINKAETAKRLACGARTLDTWMKRGLVPYYKISKKVVFKWSEVEAAIKARFHVNRGGF